MVKKKAQIRKWTNDLTKDFAKEDIQRANKYMQKSSISLATREMQSKTTIRYHYTPTRMAKIKSCDNTKCW